jgi:hypothetical protein
VHLASQLRSLALAVSDVELKLAGRSEILDCMMDLHNDLTQWSVDTEHGKAAEEVMAIVDEYLLRVQKAGLTASTTEQKN